MFNNDLVIIDGSFLLHRVFHATKPYIENSARKISYIIHRIVSAHPECESYVVFDKGGCIYRKELSPAYKANRPPQPDILYKLRDNIMAMEERKGRAVVCREGIEGDDLIASLKKKHGANRRTYIYTIDKDIYQLIDLMCSIVDPFTMMLYDADQTLIRLGVPPCKVWLKLALMGDSSDGIKGVTGIGEVNARRLANQYTDIDDLLIGEPQLECHRDVLVLNKQLVLLRDNVI